MEPSYSFNWRLATPWKYPKLRVSRKTQLHFDQKSKSEHLNRPFFCQSALSPVYSVGLQTPRPTAHFQFWPIAHSAKWVFVSGKLSEKQLCQVPTLLAGCQLQTLLADCQLQTLLTDCQLFLLPTANSIGWVPTLFALMSSNYQTLRALTVPCVPRWSSCRPTSRLRRSLVGRQNLLAKSL